MKPTLLEYICCPKTKGPLKLKADRWGNGEVVSGQLISQGTGEKYPIIKGIPRFVLSNEEVYHNYTESFGHQWNHYNWLRDEDRTEFEAILDRPIHSYANLRILDAGCGGGRIARYIAPVSKLYIGVDYSFACERAQELCRNVEQAHFIQADIHHLPFKDQPLFDFAFSHGVLHHSPSTKQGFTGLVPLVRPGGELYIAVFRKAVGLFRLSDGLARSVISRLPTRAQESFCRFLVRLRGLPNAQFFKRFLWFSLQENAEVATFCNYDWYAPRYHHEHTAVEVMNWFAQCGFNHIQYINAWPYCPPDDKYAIPSFLDSFRLGQLVGVVGKKMDVQKEQPTSKRTAA